MMEMMKWNHLPQPGGYYDQDPELLALWRVIFSERSAHQVREHEQQKKDMEAQKSRSGKAPPKRGRVAGR